MTAKEFLNQYKILSKKVDGLRAEYQAQRAAIDSIRTSLEGEGGRTLEISRPVERMAVKLAEKAEELKEAETEALRIRQEIVEVIIDVPGVAGRVLYERFVLLKRWGDVAAAVGYEKRQVQRYYKKGLELVAGKKCCHTMSH